MNPVHYDFLTKEQQVIVISELLDANFEPWEILNGTYEFEEDGTFWLILGEVH